MDALKRAMEQHEAAERRLTEEIARAAGRCAEYVTWAGLIPASGSIPVLGRVRGAENAPVPQAEVTLTSVEGLQLSRSEVRPDGSYAVNAPDVGSYVLITTADGYDPQESTIVVDDESVVHDVLLTSASG
ncbi:carboxypeptidase-like regulatory domain-containing protein [Streptomyces sp. NPDC088560]|uniref:carboxypeptidase-like regulatory domain-containing protein n=1 Tax=Streptomyces sp. NPDC088560 TaxID=3365868 RepID=UPI0037FBC90C